MASDEKLQAVADVARFAMLWLTRTLNVRSSRYAKRKKG